MFEVCFMFVLEVLCLLWCRFCVIVLENRIVFCNIKEIVFCKLCLFIFCKLILLILIFFFVGLNKCGINCVNVDLLVLVVFIILIILFG